jgi:hypothetical protein
MRLRILVVLALLTMMLLLVAEEIEKEAVKPEIVKLELIADTLQATITIPETQHMTKQEDYVYIDLVPVEGVTLGATVWSEGAHLDELGFLVYEKQAVLKRQIKVAEALQMCGVNLKVLVGYQMCFPTYCEPPVEEEFDIAIPGRHCGNCPGKM